MILFLAVFAIKYIRVEKKNIICVFWHQSVLTSQNLHLVPDTAANRI